jgi:hypothetical protein
MNKMNGDFVRMNKMNGRSVLYQVRKEPAETRTAYAGVPGGAVFPVRGLLPGGVFRRMYMQGIVRGGEGGGNENVLIVRALPPDRPAYLAPAIFTAGIKGAGVALPEPAKNLPAG